MAVSRDTANERVRDRGFEFLSDYVHTNVNCTIKCAKNHTWFARPAHVLRGIGCPVCRRISATQADERVAHRGLRFSGYTLSKRKCVVHGSCGHSWVGLPYDVFRGVGCPICAAMPDLTVADANNRVAGRGIVFGSDYRDTQTKCSVSCSSCGHPWASTPNNIFNGSGCPKCATPVTDNDCIYIATYDKYPGYKIGISSWVDGDRRPYRVALKRKAKMTSLRRWNVPDARSLEAIIHRRYTNNPLTDRLDGWTEFRVLTELEFTDVVCLIEANAHG
jgi:hypothetical protein